MREILFKILPLLTLLLVGCEKEIDFKYHDIDPILVIEGALTEEGAVVSLTETTPMDEPMNHRQVEGATVSIIDLDNGDVAILDPSADGGPYIADIAGIQGHTYRLEVLRPGGKEPNRADCVMLPPAPAPQLSLAWISMPYDHVAVLQVRFEGDTEECYWVRVYRNGEAYMWRAVSGGAAVANGIIDEVFMTTRQDISEEEDDTVLVDGDVLTVTVSPISRAMHDYLEAIGSDSSGPLLFSGPMALGYFLAAPVSSAQITFDTATIPYF